MVQGAAAGFFYWVGLLFGYLQKRFKQIIKTHQPLSGFRQMASYKNEWY